MKFNYQAVFKIDDDSQVIFVGSSDLTPGNLYLSLSCYVDKMLGNIDATCMNFIYQPLKVNENETQTQK